MPTLSKEKVIAKKVISKLQPLASSGKGISADAKNTARKEAEKEYYYTRANS